jgi:tRNA(Ile)-lysidine synthase
MLAINFAAAMDRLAPFEPAPSLAVAVSGGADSMTLAILAASWVRQRGGSVLALVVDHGLRPASATEAQITIDRLAKQGIASRLLNLTNLRPGAALAERARTMRYEALTEACRATGILHLLLGHHAVDQVETVMMRVLRGSRTNGLAGMSALRETGGVRLLRPLLGIEPAGLRRFLVATRSDWVEDPSNQDLRATRPRLRYRLPPNTPLDLAPAIAAVGQMRAREETDVATELAHRASIRPEGFAFLSPGRISQAALSRLIRTLGGLSYPPSLDHISDLAAHPRPATIAGVRISHAGRPGEGLLVGREEAAIMQSIELTPGTIWDNRFHVIGYTGAPATIGKLGVDAAHFRRCSDLPSSVLRTIPAIRCGELLLAVPHIGYTTEGAGIRVKVRFSPPEPAAGQCFVAMTASSKPLEGVTRAE